MVTMLKIPLLSLLFQGIPEGISFSALCFALLKQRLEWKVIIPMGTCASCLVYLVRLLPIAPGIHTCIVFLFMMIMLKLYTRQELSKVVFCDLLSLILLDSLEIAFTRLVSLIFNLSYTYMVQHVIIWILVGLPQVICLLLLALALNRRNTQKLASDLESPWLT